MPFTNPRNNRQRGVPASQQTDIRSGHQDNFGRGEIRSQFYGNSPSPDFQKGLRELINFDITEQNDLVKRSGAVESPVFAGFVDKKVIYGTERVVENIEGTDPQGTHTVAQRNVNIITNLPFLLLGQVFHEGCC